MLLLLLDYFKIEDWEKRWETTYMQRGMHLLSLYSSLQLTLIVVLNQNMEKLLYVFSTCLGKAVSERFVKVVIISLP